MSQRPLTRGRYSFFPLGFHGPARTHVWTPGSRPGDWEPLSQTPRPHLLQRSPRPSLTLLRYPPTRTPPEAPSGSPLCIVLSLETSLPLPCSSFCREPSSAAPRPQPEGAEERGPPPRTAVSPCAYLGSCPGHAARDLGIFVPRFWRLCHPRSTMRAPTHDRL